MQTIDKVIEGGYCVGCGICASVKDTSFEMSFNEGGFYSAVKVDENKETFEEDKVCPFTDNSKNEDEVSNIVFRDIPNIKNEPILGNYLDLYAGSVTEGSYRELGSSGGGVSWLIKELIDKEEIDGLIHVKESSSSDLIFEYSVSHSLEEIRSGAKSRYYPIELSNALEEIRSIGKGKKYAVVGIPCFIKGLRNLALNDNEINDRIKYFIGIVCGHLKSKNFASLFAWQHGIHPDNLVNIDFRNKVKSSDAGLYTVKLTYLNAKKQEEVMFTKSAIELYGTDWGLGFFKYKACDYCDDILGETADVIFGDAWVPGYREDWRGDNVVVVRNEVINKIFKAGINSKLLEMNNVEADLIKQSQAGSIRHRRRGLKYRLKVAKNKGVWHPKKRVKPLDHDETEKFIKTQEFRMWFVDNVTMYFNEALNAGSFKVFKRKMFIPILKYKYLVYGLKGVLPSRVKRIYRFLLKKSK